MFNNQMKEDKMSEQQKRLENLNRQLRIQDVLSVLITQSTKLIELVNANQKEVNRLKVELDHLKAKEVV